MATGQKTVTVQDITDPVIAALPGPTTINCPATPVFAQATARDLCDGTVSLTSQDVTTPGNCPGNYSVTRTWTATDDCGNTTTASQTIHVQDITKPVIDALPGPTTINCPATPVFAQATARDLCDGTVSLTSQDVTTPGNCAGNYSVTRTWTATDDCGNTTTASQTIHVQDIAKPVIDALPAPTTINCPATPFFSKATATDLCDAVVSLTFQDVPTPGNCPGNYSVTRTWTATDDCGNTTTASQTIHVQDITKPVIDALPAPTTINCPATPVFAQATARDLCDGIVSLTSQDVTTPGNCPGNYSVTRTWTATDDCGNTATASQTIHVQDITKPVIDALPAPTTINCPATPVFAKATATDLCDAVVSLTSQDVTTPGNCPGNYSVTRTWTATDDCGNTATASQTIHVQDITKPVIDALPAPTTINCPATPAFAKATATDLCDAVVSLTFQDVPTPGNCPGNYSVTRTWTATDDCGNTATASQTINVQDITKPELTVPVAYNGIKNPSCQYDASPGITGQATATDLCDPSVLVTYTDVIAPNTECSTVITRTWKAEDDCGNVTTGTQTITFLDKTKPVLTVPEAYSGMKDANCAYSALPAVTGTARATDNCDATVSVTYTDAVTPGECTTVIIRTWKAEDNCGNMATATQTITFRDLTAPTFTKPADIILYADEDCEVDLLPVNTGTPTNVLDNCDTSPTLNYTDSEGLCNNDPAEVNDGTGIIRQITIRGTGLAEKDMVSIALQFSTNQGKGNTQFALVSPSGKTVVLVAPYCNGTYCKDVDPNTREFYNPVFKCSAATMWNNSNPIPYAPAQTGEYKPWGTSTSMVGTEFELRLKGMVPNFSGFVNCFDQLSSAPGSMDMGTWTIYGLKEKTINGSITFLGACIETGTCTSDKYITRKWTATDNCGNTSPSQTQYITVLDNMAPVIKASGTTLNLGCNPSPAEINAALGTATALDNCDGVLTPTMRDSAVTGADCSKSQTRTWTVTDLCGNVATPVSRIVTWKVDLQDPQIFCPANKTLYVEAGVTSSTWTIVPPVVSDNCTPAASLVVTGVRSDGKPLADPWPLGTTTVTWTVKDECNNTSEPCMQTVTVIAEPDCLTLNAKVLLEGSLVNPDNANQSVYPMRTTLNDKQMLPGQTFLDFFGSPVYSLAGQPYNRAPWNYTGAEGAGFDTHGIAGDAGYEDSVVDWVLVSLRTAPGGDSRAICQKSALLHKDGTIEMVEGFECCDMNMNGSYYLVVEHRNHLIVMSHQAIPIVNGTLTYDFTLQQSYIDANEFGSWGQKLIGGKYAMIAGNGNQSLTPASDTDINADDRNFWETENSQVGYRRADYNMNGDTNANDRILWEKNNGITTSVIRN